MLHPDRESTGMTSRTKLTGGFDTLFTWTGTDTVRPAALTVTVVAPDFAGTKKPSESRFTIGSAGTNLALSVRSFQNPSAVRPDTVSRRASRAFSRVRDDGRTRSRVIADAFSARAVFTPSATRRAATSQQCLIKSLADEEDDKVC